MPQLVSESDWFGRVDAAVAGGRSRATKLEAVAGFIRSCRLCGLWQGRRHAVPGEGDAAAALMIVSEGPGASEDAAGRPFAGRAGGQLELMLSGAGIDRQQVFITNVVKCRAAERGEEGRRRNRAPRAAEVRACHPYLTRQVALVRPRVILCLGSHAGKGLLGPGFTIGKQRGRWFEGPYEAVIIATYHPSFVKRGGGPSVSGARLAGQVRRDLEQVGRRLAAQT